MSGKKDKKKKKKKMEIRQRKTREMSAAVPEPDYPDLNHLAPPWREFYRLVIKQLAQG